MRGCAVATRSHGTLCDIYKRGSCVSSWLRDTRYAVIYTREEVVLVAGYAVRSEWLQ